MVVLLAFCDALAIIFWGAFFAVEAVWNVVKAVLQFIRVVIFKLQNGHLPISVA